MRGSDGRKSPAGSKGRTPVGLGANPPVPDADDIRSQ